MARSIFILAVFAIPLLIALQYMHSAQAMPAESRYEQVHEAVGDVKTLVVDTYVKTKEWGATAAEDTKEWASGAAVDTKQWASGAAVDTKQWASGAAEDTKTWVSGAARDTGAFFKNIFG